jgi:hypothetical protein
MRLSWCVITVLSTIGEEMMFVIKDFMTVPPVYKIMSVPVGAVTQMNGKASADGTSSLSSFMTHP